VLLHGLSLCGTVQGPECGVVRYVIVRVHGAVGSHCRLPEEGGRSLVSFLADDFFGLSPASHPSTELELVHLFIKHYTVLRL